VSVASAEARAIVAAARRQGRPRAVAVTAALVVALLAVTCASVSIGDYPIPLVDVVPAIVGVGPGDVVFIVQELRLPRAVCAILVGVALGASGAVIQSMVRNELASPDVIGITAGASAAAVLMIVVYGAGSVALSLAALAGGLATALLIYALAFRRGVQGYRLILVGIGIAAALGALTSYLVLQASLTELQRANVWLTGSLNGASWATVRPLAVAVAVLLPAVLLLVGGLRALQLGDDAAKGIGVRVEVVRGLLALGAVGLAAFATAAAGPVAFVAFVSAPIARRLVGTGDVAIVPAALFGALLLQAADLVARDGLGAIELPVGILTGILGAPYLVWLLIRTNRAGAGA